MSLSPRPAQGSSPIRLGARKRADSGPEVPPGPAKMEVTVDYTQPGQSGPKRTLSMAQMLLLNCIVCGLEFCASAAFCYIPPMLLKAGLPEENMSIVLGIGPLLGFFFVPIIGRASDRCRSRYGRRRPFIFGLSLVLILSLLIIPYGELVGEYFVGKGEKSKHIGVILLIIGSVMLDFASQACLTPCEALLSDASRNTDQYDRCFTVYSFMVSVGGCIGYLITALDWSANSIGVYFGTQERSAFSMLIILFSFSMFASLGVAQESPVPALETQTQEPGIDTTQINKKLDQIHQALLQEKDLDQRPLGLAPCDPGYESGSNHSVSEESPSNTATALIPDPPTLPPFGLFRERNCSIPGTRLSFTSCDSLMWLLLHRIYHILPNMVKSLLHVPFVLRPLALANFFSWTAIMGFNLFYTDFVGQAVYGGDPNADENSPLRELYDTGVRMGSWGLLLHCATSAIYATFVERLVSKYGTRVTYMVGMFTFTIVMILMVFIRNIYLVTLLAACTGFAYSTVTTIPFMLITQYHDHKEIFFYDTRGDPVSAVGVRGVGTDMATLDSAYFLSQVVLSAVMGYVVHLTGTVLAYIVCAGSMGAVSCACITRIITNKMQMQVYVKSERLRSTSVES